MLLLQIRQRISLMPLEPLVEKDSSSEQILTVMLKMPIPELPMRLQKVGTTIEGSTDYANTHFKECIFVQAYLRFIFQTVTSKHPHFSYILA